MISFPAKKEKADKKHEFATFCSQMRDYMVVFKQSVLCVLFVYFVY